MANLKCLTAALVSVVICLLVTDSSVYASAPYRSLGYFDRHPYPIQSLYVPERVIGDILYTNEDGVRSSVDGLSGPTGLFIDTEGYLYVSDTANNRVVKMDEDGVLLAEFGLGEDERGWLSEPEGLYVAPNGNVYVCDTGNNRIAVFNGKGEWIDQIVKPDAVSLTDVTFIPASVAMDIRGFLYVASKGANEGLMVIAPDKTFEGFFGANKVNLTPLDRLKRLLYTEKQRESSAVGAASVSDVFIDREGFIYTSTMAAATEQIKKYNIGGENLFRGKNMQVGDNRQGLAGSYSGITVDPFGNIFGMDAGSGRIYQFDPDGTPVFSFGRKLLDNRLKMGLFGDPVSIKVDAKGYLFVTDRLFNGVQVFRPTEFLNKIRKADMLFSEGQYEDAKKSSEEVLKHNVFYYKAHYIISKALYREHEWKASMARFRLVHDTNGYSDAFWEWRVVWVRNYFGYVVAGIILMTFSLITAVKLKRRRRSA